MSIIIVCNFYTVPVVTLIQAHLSTPTSVLISWHIPDTSIIERYTITTTRLCDFVHLNSIDISGSFTSFLVSVLSSGLQYRIEISPINRFGKGAERSYNITLPEIG